MRWPTLLVFLAVACQNTGGPDVEITSLEEAIVEDSALEGGPVCGNDESVEGSSFDAAFSDGSSSPKADITGYNLELLQQERVRLADLEQRRQAYNQAVADLEAFIRAGSFSQQQINQREIEIEAMVAEIRSLEAQDRKILGTPVLPEPPPTAPLPAPPSAEAEAAYLQLVGQYDMDDPNDVLALEKLKMEMLGR
jgi:hypothetical protein